MQKVLGCFQERLAYSEEPMEDLAGEKVNNLTQLLAQSDKRPKTKKCPVCGEVKPIRDFSRDRKKKDGCYHCCKLCKNKDETKYRSTETGFLKHKYAKLYRKEKEFKRLLTFEEFVAAWEKHKSIYGMRSAWGPGPHNLEQHKPITIIWLGKGGSKKGKKPIASNLSIDRLDNNRDYTIQNILFIRGDENARKKNTSYEDCKIQMRLHEERFKNEME